MSRFTLEEQRNVAKAFITTGPHQYQVKKAIYETLNNLVELRLEAEKGPAAVNSDRFAELLANVLGESPTIKSVSGS